MSYAKCITCPYFQIKHAPTVLAMVNFWMYIFNTVINKK